MNILVSYYFARRDADRWDYWLREASQQGWSILIDSGAFSAFTQRDTIDLDAYCRFLERREPLLWDYIALDVVNDAPSTLRNLQAMVMRGLQPMPVLTEDMPTDRVPELMATSQNERVCIAGPTHWPTSAVMARMRLAGQVAPRAALHGLGLTRETAAWRCGASSVDSSTWAVGTRYGKLSTFSMQAGCTQHDWRVLRSSDRNAWPRSVQALVLRAGISREDVDAEWFARGAMSGLNLITCLAWLQFAEFAARRNVRFFFATTSLQQLMPLAAACTMLNGGTLRASYQRGCELLQMWKEDRARAIDAVLRSPWPV